MKVGRALGECGRVATDIIFSWKYWIESINNLWIVNCVAGIKGGSLLQSRGRITLGNEAFDAGSIAGLPEVWK